MPSVEKRLSTRWCRRGAAALHDEIADAMRKPVRRGMPEGGSEEARMAEEISWPRPALESRSLP